LQMTGLSDGFEELVIRGNMEASNFIAFYLKDGVIIAADSVNRPGDFMAAKRLVGDRREISSARLTDESVPLKSLMVAAAA
jgi:3-phenylpropionate/trans-cinnamate dioxygenase ferredoxin reductase subunit